MKLSVCLRYALLAAPLAMLMAIAPFAALGAMLFGGLAWSFFKPNSAPRWTFARVRRRIVSSPSPAKVASSQVEGSGILKQIC